MEKPSTRQKLPKWLVNIQYNSWEPELFISGGAIFTLLQIPQWLNQQSILIKQQTGFIESILIAHFLLVAINGLTLGFALHIIMRGFWIGMVCLSYVYPQGANIAKMKFAENFENHLEKEPDIVSFVDRLEQICSLVFAFSFIFFLVIIGALVTAMVIIPHSALEAQIGAQLFMGLRVLSGFGMLLAFIYMLDFLTLGWIKKQKHLARLYYPIYMVFSILTLAFAYRSAYYTFITNTKPYKAYLTFAVFIISSFLMTAALSPVAKKENEDRLLLSYSNGSEELHLDCYENLRDHSELIQRATIQSDIIAEDYIKLFVVHHKIMERAIGEKWIAENVGETMDKIEFMKKLYEVTLDGKLQQNIKWRFFEHPQTQERGIIAYIHIKDVDAGEHRINVNLCQQIKLDQKILEDYGINMGMYAAIPFWRE
ncbi:hypothetical protein [Sediminitomix flava]|uniref:Uncharacterized protein n=1 Tax=Sediminitomix flava TaxID=379075 RepID=A0A315ZC44_SEDFL|nr:hypothetical protein [Sediminitomix flava]PWJ42890.1 hypothetical protein BC781_102436 [Sediminitomix flava]